MTARAVRRAAVLVVTAASLASTAGLADAGRSQPLAAAAATAGGPDPEFADAVARRVFVLTGRLVGPSAAVVASFAELQKAVELAIPTFVDPADGKAWQVDKLLKSVTGRSGWLPAAAGSEKRTKQIEQALLALAWRPVDASVSSQSTALQRLAEHRDFVGGCDSKTGSPNAATAAEWARLYPIAAAAPATVIPRGLEVYAGWGGEQAVASVEIQRNFYVLPLGRTLPILGYPVDAAKLLVDASIFAQTITDVHLLTTVKTVPASWSLTPADWDWGAAGVPLATGTIPATTVKTGSVQVPFDVPARAILAAGRKASEPRFAPALAVRLGTDEPPPGWPPTTGSWFGTGCSWVHGAQIGDALLLYHQAFPPLRGDVVHLGAPVISFTDRFERERARLRERIYSLGTSKLVLDRSVKAAAARLERALTDSAAVQADSEAVTRALDATKAALERLAEAERSVPAALKPLARQRDFLAREAVRLQDLILTGHGQQAALVDQLDSVQRRLDAADAKLRAAIGKRPDLAAATATLAAALKSLDDRLFELEKARAHADTELSFADAALQRLVTERSRVDSELVDAARNLAGLDLTVDKITAMSPAGTVVYRARLTGPFDALEKLDAAVASLRESIARLATVRDRARTAYFAALDASLLQGRYIERLIMKVAWAKGGIDFVFNAFDVAKAGAKGGLIGAVSETLKKATETFVTEVVVNRYVKPDGIDPTDIEAQINNEYGAGLKDGLGFGPLAKTGAERIVKDTLSKYVKDGWLNPKLGTLVFEKVVWPNKLAAAEKVIVAAVSSGIQPGVVRAQVAALEKLQGQLGQLGKGYKLKLENVAESVLKDAVKTGLKAYLDSVERGAWVDLFKKDIAARALRPAYVVATDTYWQAADEVQRLLEQKVELIEGYDPKQGIRVEIDQRFPAGTALTIDLTVRRARGSRSDPTGITVLVGGERAVGSGDQFRAKAAGPGTVSLELR